MALFTRNPLISRLLGWLGMAIGDGVAVQPWLTEITIDRKGEAIVLSCARVVLIEARGDFVSIETADNSFLKPGTIAHYERYLDPEIFLRIHRSRIVNKKKIARISRLTDERLNFHMNNDKVAGSSQKYHEAILRALPELA